MYVCEICGFETSRLANFKRHINRKKSCKREDGECPAVSSVVPKRPSVVPNVVPNGPSVVPKRPSVVPNVVPNGSSVVPNVVPKLYGSVPKKVVNKSQNELVRSFETNSEVEKNNNTYDCEICGMIFSNRQNRYRHVKRGKCKRPLAVAVCEPVDEDTQQLNHLDHTKHVEDATTCSFCGRSFSRADSLKRHVVGCRVKNSRGIVTTNNTTTTNHHNHHNNNTMNNCHNTHVNYTINYNSFDKPCIDHVTKEHVKELYLGNNRNLKKLIHAGVCEIWKKKENNSFRFPFHDEGKGIPNRVFRDNETMEVFADGQERLFPADHVVEVVLQKSAEVIESYLRQHHNEETIIGTGVLKHANVLEELACNFQEVWDEDKMFRSMYKPFVRTALLECMRYKYEQEKADREADREAGEEADRETSTIKTPGY